MNDVDAKVDLRARGERPMFLADWTGAVFIHFAFEPAELQPHVPFTLDVAPDGKAYVSLVAFTQRRLRPSVGGRLAALLSAPLAEHEFLNLRTYVIVNGEPAIQFLAEWIPNRLAVLVGPVTYGLPYRLGRLDYANETREARGTVRCMRETLGYVTKNPVRIDTRLRRVTDKNVCPTEPAALDDFLLERYAAWTMREGVARRFRIWHEPWRVARVDVTLTERTLIDKAVPWMRGHDPVLAHHTPGVRDVWIGRPERVELEERPGTDTWRRRLPRILEEETRAERPRQGGHRRLLLDAGPALAFPMMALLTRSLLPAWGFMWVFAFALFFACKWITFRTATRTRMRPSIRRVLAYLFLWVGMDAERFLDATRRPLAPLVNDWIGPMFNTFVGAALLWNVVPRFAMAHGHPLAVGWTGMLGLVLMLHFGTFHLLALAWQHAGIDAEPLMNRPTRAATLGEFWGLRWNRGFHRLAERWIFGPLRRPLGASTALLGTFVVSGIVHDLVISLPAHGGYGLPTLYFTIQGVALLAQRRMDITRGAGARAFTIAMTVAPMFILFHPAFVTEIVLPFMTALGALPDGAFP